MRRKTILCVIFVGALPLLAAVALKSDRGTTAGSRRPAHPPSSIPSVGLSGRPCQPPDRVVFRHSPFGLHAAGMGFHHAQDLNARFLRKIVMWKDVEPQPRQYKIAAMDGYMTRLQATELDLVVTLRVVSRWGVDIDYQALKAEKPGKEWFRFCGYPRNMNAWLESVERFVERYDGDGQDDMPGLKRPIRFWQICNEPFWQWRGTMEQYVDLVRQTARTIRQTDPNAKIILGAFTGGLDMMKSELAQGRGGAGKISATVAKRRAAIQALDYILERSGPHFDIFEFHAYDDAPHELALQICWFRERMKKFGYSKTIWSMENAGPFIRFTPERCAEHVVKRHMVALAYGVEGFFWSTLYPTRAWSKKYQRLALVDRWKRTTPAYDAYRIMANKLSSIQSISILETPPEISAFQVQLTDGVVYVVWSNNGDFPWSLPHEAKAARVTHVTTKRGQSQPQVDHVTSTDGHLTLRVSAPVFVEPEPTN